MAPRQPSRPLITARRFFPSKRARVQVVRMPHQFPMAQHGHDFLEIAVVLSGSGIHVTGKERHRLEAGDVLVISTRRTHGFEQTASLNLVNILFRGSLFSRLSRDLGALAGFHSLFPGANADGNRQPYLSRLRLNASELEQISDWMDRMEEETHLETHGGYLLAEAYLSLIIGVLARRYGRQSAASLPHSARFGKLLSWMERNLERGIGVKELANRAAMSERSFYREFKRVHGATPFDYLLKTRIRRAKELLSQRAAMSITEVAARCGFEDSNYFTRYFRKVAGMSPSAYRRRT